MFSFLRKYWANRAYLELHQHPNEQNLEALLMALKKIDDREFVRNIITSLNKDSGCHILHLSIREKVSLKAIRSLLQFIEKLDQKNVADLEEHIIHPNGYQLIPSNEPIEEKSNLMLLSVLSTLNSDRWSVLLLAAHYHPECVATLLTEINQLQDNQVTAQMLTQVTSDGLNALLLAIRHHPEIVSPLLAAINQLEDKLLTTQILTRITSNGWLALLMAAHSHQDVVISPLDESKEPPIDKQENVLALAKRYPSSHKACMQVLDEHSEDFTKMGSNKTKNIPFQRIRFFGYDYQKELYLQREEEEVDYNYFYTG